MSATATKSSGWVRFRGACPACGHAGNWCTRTCDGQIIKCSRTESDRPIKQRDGSTAWLHRADRIGGTMPTVKAPPSPPRRSTAEWRGIIRQHQTAVNPKRLEAMAGTLGLSVRSLKLYGIGLDVGDGRGGVGSGWWSFPMFNGELKPIGIRLRAEDGQKKCVWGSANGLFVPADYAAERIIDGVADDDAPLLLLLPEGPTSSAAAADLGFRAVGRPNNRLGAGMIRQLLGRGYPQDVVIVADHEPMKWIGVTDPTPAWPGWEGALHLAGELVGGPGVRRLRVVKVRDAAGNRVKDLRAFLQSGGVANVVNAIIAQAEDVDSPWLKSRWAEVELWRGRLKKNQLPAAGAAKGLA
jgi:hypothetical protein